MGEVVEVLQYMFQTNIDTEVHFLQGQNTTSHLTSDIFMNKFSIKH